MDNDELQGAKRFRDLLSANTVRLIGLDVKKHPIAGWGSGVLWSRGDKLSLLTVYHNFRNGRIFVDIGITHNNGTCLIPVGEPGFLNEAKIVGQDIVDARDTDFAWADLNVKAFAKSLPAAIQNPSLPVYRSSFEEPTQEHYYGFAAHIGDWYHPRSRELSLRMAYELYMTFDGVQQDGEYAGSYRFQLARKHNGHDYYRGSSGAPIADETGKIVALVRSGNLADNVIYACPLHVFSRYIDL